MTRFTSILVVILASCCAVGLGQKPVPNDKSKEPPNKVVDWAGLRTLLEAGEYAKATAAADVIIELVSPNRKAPDFLARSRDTIDALMRRGFAELQLGRLDAAEATFVATQEVFKDREFQKQLSTMEKLDDPKLEVPMVDLDLRAIELQNLRAAVCLERLRLMHASQAAASGASKPPEPAVVEAVAGQVEAIRAFIKASADVRKKLSERFENAGATVVGSPHKRALMSNFHPELIAGIATFELSRLPFEMPPAPEAEGDKKAEGTATILAVNGLDRGQLLEKSLAHFDAASKALDGVFGQTLPNDVKKAPPDKRLEAELLSLRLSLARCAARLQYGDVEGARKEVNEVLDLHKDMTGIRKVANGESHPELFVPLVLATEIALAESDEQSKAGMGDEARGMAAKASELLARAAALPLADDHPRRYDLARLAAALGNRRAKFEASVVTTDAAEVAARRIRRAVEGTAAGF